MKIFSFRHRLLAAALAGLAGCAVGPDYQRPAMNPPAQWSEANAAQADGAVWKAAAPGDAWPKGEWWQIFGDAQLNALQRQAQLGNLDLQAALARLEQARALAQVSHSALLPTIGLEGGRTRARTSANRPNTGNSNTIRSTVRDDNTAALTADYELDFFGRVRRDIEAGDAGAQQAGADLENVRLLLAADVAANYFSLRALEAELAVLEQSIAVQSGILDVVRARHDDGVASGIDLAQQELIVSSNRSQQQLLLRQYQQQRHALATLLGITVDEFKLDAGSLPALTPAIPVALPGELLQRRPDIASAERAVAVANAQIGIARAAWFPTFTLNAQDGFESGQFNTLFDAPSAAWSLGLAFTQTVFDAGRTGARERYAIARHREATANYRKTVLSAWQEVEDQLASSRTLAAAQREAIDASDAANRIADITEDRYQLGLASAIDRYVARQNALAAQREVQQLAGQQWVNTVLLIKTLGGGWSTENIARNN